MRGLPNASRTDTTRHFCVILDVSTTSALGMQPPRLYKLVFRYTTEGKLLWEDHHDLRLQSVTGVNISSMKLGWDPL